MNVTLLEIPMPAVARIQLNLPTTVQMALENLWLKDTVLNVSCPYPETFPETLKYALGAVERIKFTPFANLGDFQEDANVCNETLALLKNDLDAIVKELLVDGVDDAYVVDLTSRYKLEIPFSIQLSFTYEANDTLAILNNAVITASNPQSSPGDVIYALTGSHLVPPGYEIPDQQKQSLSKRMKQLYNTADMLQQFAKRELENIGANTAEELTSAQTWVNAIVQKTEASLLHYRSLYNFIYNKGEQVKVDESKDDILFTIDPNDPDVESTVIAFVDEMKLLHPNARLWMRDSFSPACDATMEGYMITPNNVVVDTANITQGLIVTVVNGNTFVIESIESLAQYSGGKTAVTWRKLISLN